MFVLVPLFAALVHVVRRRSGCTYPQHLLFALHVHAAVFGAAAVLALLRMAMPESVMGDEGGRGLVVIAAAIYLVMAFRIAYGGTKGQAIRQTIFVMLIYGFALVLATAAIVVPTILGRQPVRTRGDAGSPRRRRSAVELQSQAQATAPQQRAAGGSVAGIRRRRGRHALLAADPGDARERDRDFRSPGPIAPANSAKTRSREKSLTFEATPIHFDGRLYLSTSFGKVIALDPATGREVWTYDAKISRTMDYSEVTSRGVSSWRDSRATADAANAPCAARIFLGTIDARLIALDAKTGQPCAGFGANGIVNLKTGVHAPSTEGDYQVTSPPAILRRSRDRRLVDRRQLEHRYRKRHRAIVRRADGRAALELAAGGARERERRQGRRGQRVVDDLRRRLARSGVRADDEPEPRFLRRLASGRECRCEFGGGAARIDRRARVGVPDRASRSVGLRHRGAAGARHRDARWPEIPAVAQATKMGSIFLLDRLTGTPIWPVEERPVPKTDIAGETISPTQPFTVTPRSLMPTGPITPDTVWGMNDKDRAECRALAAQYRSEGIYTPPSLQRHDHVSRQRLRRELGQRGGGSVASTAGREHQPLRDARAVDPARRVRSRARRVGEEGRGLRIRRASRRAVRHAAKNFPVIDRACRARRRPGARWPRSISRPATCAGKCRSARCPTSIRGAPSSATRRSACRTAAARSSPRPA